MPLLEELLEKVQDRFSTANAAAAWKCSLHAAKERCRTLAVLGKIRASRSGRAYTFTKIPESEWTLLEQIVADCRIPGRPGSPENPMKIGNEFVVFVTHSKNEDSDDMKNRPRESAQQTS